jgi:nitric oxide reductase subunit B
VLLLRALLPAFKDKNLKSLLFVVVLATVSIGLLYAAGFMWGKNTNLSIMEYWRSN